MAASNADTTWCSMQSWIVTIKHIKCNNKPILSKPRQWYCNLSGTKYTLILNQVKNDGQYKIDLRDCKLDKIREHKYRLHYYQKNHNQNNDDQNNDDQNLTFDLYPKGSDSKYYEYFQQLVECIRNLIDTVKAIIVQKAHSIAEQIQRRRSFIAMMTRVL